MPGEVSCPAIKLHRFTTAENLRHLRRDAQLAYSITALCPVDPSALDVTPSVSRSVSRCTRVLPMTPIHESSQARLYAPRLAWRRALYNLTKVL